MTRMQRLHLLAVATVAAAASIATKPQFKGWQVNNPESQAAVGTLTLSESTPRAAASVVVVVSAEAMGDTPVRWLSIAVRSDVLWTVEELGAGPAVLSLSVGAPGQTQGPWRRIAVHPGQATETYALGNVEIPSRCAPSVSCRIPVRIESEFEHGTGTAELSWMLAVEAFAPARKNQPPPAGAAVTVHPADNAEPGR